MVSPQILLILIFPPRYESQLGLVTENTRIFKSLEIRYKDQANRKPTNTRLSFFGIVSLPPLYWTFCFTEIVKDKKADQLL